MSNQSKTTETLIVTIGDNSIVYPNIKKQGKDMMKAGLSRFPLNLFPGFFQIFIHVFSTSFSQTLTRRAPINGSYLFS
ncbi:hypothetical protein AZE31_04815 [Paenibacillus polymyxa]|nr:hypothetical protein AZE31_04815 [Paenibacillus polymyxa]